MYVRWGPRACHAWAQEEKSKQIKSREARYTNPVTIFRGHVMLDRSRFLTILNSICRLAYDFHGHESRIRLFSLNFRAQHGTKDCFAVELPCARRRKRQTRLLKPRRTRNACRPGGGLGVQRPQLWQATNRYCPSGSVFVFTVVPSNTKVPLLYQPRTFILG